MKIYVLTCTELFSIGWSTWKAIFWTFYCKKLQRHYIYILTEIWKFYKYPSNDYCCGRKYRSIKGRTILDYPVVLYLAYDLCFHEFYIRFYSYFTRIFQRTISKAPSPIEMTPMDWSVSKTLFILTVKYYKTVIVIIFHVK